MSWVAEMQDTIRSGREDAPWQLYIVECSNGSFYTGITTDVERRIREHNAGKASRYTRSRRPVRLMHVEVCGSRSRALVREREVKSLPRKAKEEFIKSQSSRM